MATAGTIVRDRKTGQFSVLGNDGSRTPFSTLEEAREHRSQNFPEIARTFAPESSREFGQTFMREAGGGFQQLKRGVLQATTGLPSPEAGLARPPKLEEVADLPVGALRMAGAIPAELGVQAGRLSEFVGPKLGASNEVSRRVGQVANLLTQLIPTPGKGLPQLIKEGVQNVRPFVRGLFNKSAGGGAFREMSERGTRIIQRPPSIPQGIEEGIDIMQESGRGFLRAERQLSTEINKIIGDSINAIPETALRSNEATRNAAREALNIMGSGAKRGEFTRPTERLAGKIEEFTTRAADIPEPTDVITQQLTSVVEGAGESSIQTLDELRKVVGEAIGIVSKRGDRRAGLALRKVLDGIRKDTGRFTDEFPTAVKNLRKGHQRFRQEIVPLRRFSGLQPSQIVDEVMSKTPEELIS